MILASVLLGLSAGISCAQPAVIAPTPGVPFTTTLSNNVPLAFGMEADEASRALGVPLNYVSGRQGDEIYLAFRNVGGGWLFPRNDRLYLQFRRGRLAGWKGDWGRSWMWQWPHLAGRDRFDYRHRE